jgi:glycosyltransferase involved in cell wall biosynthesis
MTGEGPLVTAVVTTYDRPAYLRRAVESVAAQPDSPFALVVGDDHSETPAAEVLADAEPDVASLRVVRHDRNRGANAARNTGVDAASGEYIAFLDDDDRWRPDKTATQVTAFRAGDDDLGLVYAGREVVDGDTVRDVTVPDGIDGDPTKTLLCRNVVGTQSSVMVRAEVAKVTPFDEEFPRWADLEWYVAVSTKCDLAAVREPLVRYEYAAHNRISDDDESLEESRRLFVEKYRELAAGYGRLFERKMRGYASFRAGSASLSARNYRAARRYFLRALSLYPLEPTFYKYALATAGGRLTHRTARATKRLLSGTPG